MRIKHRAAGGSRGVALVLALSLAAPGLAAADTAMLEVRLEGGPEGGTVLGALPMPEGTEICLHWAHSVSGGAVADCFVNRTARLVLARSYLHDFAAGLGEMPGRGVLSPAPGGGYWINDIDEALPGDGLLMRIGQARVDHRLTDGEATLHLSRKAPGALVRLQLRGDPGAGE